jgi:RND family efflux transporter MFP subunit
VNSKKNISIAGIVITSLLILCCSSLQENETEIILPAVEAVQAKSGTLPLIQRLNGLVRAENQIVIYPEISALIVKVYVKNGDQVKKGEPLIKLRETEFHERLKQAQAGYQIAKAQLRQAEAQLNEIQTELKRTQILADQGLTSPTDLETVQTRAISAEATVELAQARIKQAEATVEERKATLSQTIIRAPVFGSVGDRNAEIGMLVSPGTRLFTLGQLDNVRIEIILTDRMLSYIEEGMRAEVSTPGTFDRPMTAVVSRISPFLNPVSHSTEAEIDIANPDGELKSGMFVTVDIYYGESERATLIPVSALYENPESGITGVYISQSPLDREPSVQMNSDKTTLLTNPVPFKFVPVDIIARGRMEAGISGVDPEDWIITLGQNLLGGQSGEARVRPVKWDWVNKLQNLQHEDLMEEVVKQQKIMADDTTTERYKRGLVN